MKFPNLNHINVLPSIWTIDNTVAVLEFLPLPLLLWLKLMLFSIVDVQNTFPKLA